MSTSRNPSTRPKMSKGVKKGLQVAVIIVLIIASGAGGALYYLRYGDQLSTNPGAIMAQANQMLKVDVPRRLWPRLLIKRPDEMTMVVFASKNDDACLAMISCVPGSWTREYGNRPDRLLRAALEQYLPRFNTERWTDIEDREVTVRGSKESIKVATSFRVDDHKEVRVVDLENLSTEQGAMSLYFQTLFDSTTDDEIDTLLRSLK